MKLRLPAPLRTWTLPVDTPAEEIGITHHFPGRWGSFTARRLFPDFDAPELSDDARYWQNQRITLIVADNNLVVKEMPDEVHVWTTDLENGQPVSGRNLIAL